MTCPHGIESGACEACDGVVLSRASHDSTTDLGWAIRLAARLRAVELWCVGPPGTRLDADRFIEIARDGSLTKRLDRLRAALDGVLRKMGLMEESK